MSTVAPMACTVVQCGGLDVALWLHTAHDPSREHWDLAMHAVLEHMKQNNVPVSRLRNLVLSDGGAPNVRQRLQLHRELWRGQSSKISVVTTALSNPLKRGVATALSWLNPACGFFAPSQIRQALLHVDLAREERAIFRSLAKLQARLPRVAVLDVAAAALRSQPAATWHN
jgi:hypothetical protein